MFKKQGTSKRSASTSSGDIKPGFHEVTPTDMGEQASAGDMAWASEELVELSEEEQATVVGGRIGIWLHPKSVWLYSHGSGWEIEGGGWA
jgi:hypothetical protein